MNSSAYIANMKDVTEKDKNTLKSHAAIQETRVRCQKKKKCNRCVRTGLVESGRGLPVYREEEEEENEGKKKENHRAFFRNFRSRADKTRIHNISLAQVVRSQPNEGWSGGCNDGSAPSPRVQPPPHHAVFPLFPSFSITHERPRKN